MGHNLDETEGGLYITIDGVRTRVADAKMYSRKPAWHDLGYVNPDGFTPKEGLRFIDPDGRMDTWMQPIMITFNGVTSMTPQAHLVRMPAVDGNPNMPVIYDVVNTGLETENGWREFNPDVTDGRWKTSVGYEVISPHDIVELVQEAMLKETGNIIKAESMGFLGDYGKDGMFMAFPLDPWERDIAEALGTNVEEYTHLYLDTKRSSIVTYNSSIVAVCQNTIMAGMSQASNTFRVRHEYGARERVREALSRTYGSAIQNRELVQKAALFMLDKQVTSEDVYEIAAEVYPYPSQPDPSLIAKTKTFDERMDVWKNTVDNIEGRRVATAEIFDDKKWHKVAGITPQMDGTAFGAWQSFTFGASYAPAHNSSSHLKKLINGTNAGVIKSSYRELIKVNEPDVRKLAQYL